MYKFSILWKVIKRLNFDRVLAGWLIWFVISSAVVMIVEPGINSMGDAMWYMFVACTSIGFGDMVATTFIGRALTVIMTVLEILLVAMFSGVVVSFYLEVVRVRAQESVSMLLDKLEHLSELSPEELKQIEDKVKAMR